MSPAVVTLTVPSPRVQRYGSCKGTGTMAAELSGSSYRTRRVVALPGPATEGAHDPHAQGVAKRHGDSGQRIASAWVIDSSLSHGDSPARSPSRFDALSHRAPRAGLPRPMSEASLPPPCLDFRSSAWLGVTQGQPGGTEA